MNENMNGMMGQNNNQNMNYAQQSFNPKKKKSKLKN